MTGNPKVADQSLFFRLNGSLEGTTIAHSGLPLILVDKEVELP